MPKKKTSTKTVKKVVKKSASKKASAKAGKKTATKKSAKISKAYTKSELYSELAVRTELPKKDVVRVFDEFVDIIASHMKKGGPEKFILPGILKMVVKKVPAKKARKGISPFTGEEMIFKAKPASKKVKINALKSLKEMAT
jgi:nucleoid DNA-binding protein